MKTLIKATLAVCILFAFSSCNIKELLTKDVQIKEKVTPFVIGPQGIVSFGVSQPMKIVSADNVVLLDKTINVKIDSILSSYSITSEMLKSFKLTKATVEINVPADYQDYVALLNSFKTIKVYFDNQTKLVAEGNSVTISGHTGTVEFTITNAEILDKLNNDQVHVILTGERFPPINLNCILRTTYTVSISLLK